VLPQLKEALYKDNKLFSLLFDLMCSTTDCTKVILASAGVIDIWISRVNWLLLALPSSDLRRASAIRCLLLANYPDGAAKAIAGDAKDYVALPLLSDFV